MAELPLLLGFCKTNQLAPDVIIVDDGSTKKEGLAAFCAQHSITLIEHPFNKGKGAAIRTGMLAANQSVRIFTDADIPFQYAVFQDILQKFKSDNSLEVVCGKRSRSGYFSKIGMLRSVGSKLFSIAVNTILFRQLGDTQCGIKAFKADVVPLIFDHNLLSGFAADIEWLFLADRAGIRVSHVDAQFRNTGISSVVFWKQAVKMIGDVCRLRWYYLFKRS